jgi:carbonic anhydrase
LKGEFLNFVTKDIDATDGRVIKRYYKNDRIEVKLPCEHTKNKQGCAMEIQFYCKEEIDYTMDYPLDKIANLAFSLMFEENDTENQLFTQSWTLEDKEFMVEVENNDSAATEKFIFDTIKGLDLGNIKPKNSKLSSFHYEGSFTKPPCDENLYWYIYNTNLPIKS